MSPLLVVLLALLVLLIAQSFQVGQSRSIPCKHPPYNDDEATLPIYWINSHRNTARRKYMEKQLRYLGLWQRSYRINSILPSSISYNITRLEKPCLRNTDKDVACVASHLKAIYTAIYNPYNQRNITTFKWDSSNSFADSEYALILEDDVEFQYKIDFKALIASVLNKKFGILQLITSNVEAIDSLWNSYRNDRVTQGDYWTPNHWTDKSRDGKTALYWSTQAYIVNKRVVRGLIDDVVDEYTDSNGHTKISFKIISSFFPNNCKRTKAYPCVLSNCLFADSYIYSGAGPSYVSKIPLFSGAKVGSSSDIHPDQLPSHSRAFDRINEIQKQVRNLHNSTNILPDFIKPLKCNWN